MSLVRIGDSARNLVRGFRIPRGAGVALFAYWAFVLLQGYFRANPVDFVRVRAAFTPVIDPERFSRGNLQEVLFRIVSGHLALALWLPAVLGLGAAILVLMAPSKKVARSERFLLSFGLGMAAGMLLLLGLGLSGLWFPAMAWLAVLGGFASLWISRSILARGTGQISGVQKEGWMPVVLTGLLVAEALFALILLAGACIGPDRFYDAQVYHLAQPALFIMWHKITGLPNLMHSMFPQGMPMLYGWMWMMGGEAAIRAWRVWLGILVFAAVWRLGRDREHPITGIAAASLFATAPLFFLNATQTSVDVEVCLLILLACLAVRECSRNSSMGWLFMAGILTGAAFSIKYTVVFWAPWLALLASRTKPGFGWHYFRPSWQRLAVFSLAVFLMLAPWLVRNVSVVGNPFYPYLTQAFKGGRQWDPPRLKRFLEQQASYAVDKVADLPKLPWQLVNGHNSENYVGPALVLLAPLLLVFRSGGPGAGVVGILAGMSLLMWLGVTHIHRFLLATWALAWILVAWSVWDMGKARPWFRNSILVLLVILNGVGMADILIFWRHNVDPVEMLAGRESPREFLVRKTINQYEDAADAGGRLMPANGRVMMAGETRGVYWPRPFYTHSAYDIQAFEEIIWSSRDANEAAKRLKQKGVTHLFFNDSETYRMKFRFAYPMMAFDARQMGVIRELWQTRVREVFRKGFTALYAVSWPAGKGTGTPLPMSFDGEAMRREFEGFTQISSTGGQVVVQKMIMRPPGQ